MNETTWALLQASLPCLGMGFLVVLYLILRANGHRGDSGGDAGTTVYDMKARQYD